jgi:protein-tyrosine phosphatase
VDALNLRLEAEGVEIAVTAGAEIAMTAIGDIPSDEVPRLSLGNGPWLLIEPPFGPVATGIAELVADLARRGLRTVIAHPERCPAFHRDPALLGELIRLGSITSITAGSLVGQFGARPQSFALSLVRDELVHNVASDFHDVKARPPGLSRHLAEAGLAELEPWLTQEVPAAILDGLERLPPRPAVHLAPPRKSRSLLHPRRR